MFVAIAVPISIWDVAQHMRHWYDPDLQRCIVRIIWMVPVYAIDSWLALRFVDVNIYIGAARECYEAYVIYNFYLFLLLFLRKNPTFDASLAARPDQKHLWPIHWVRWGPALWIILCTVCVLSFVNIFLCMCDFVCRARHSTIAVYAPPTLVMFHDHVLGT